MQPTKSGSKQHNVTRREFLKVTANAAAICAFGGANILCRSAEAAAPSWQSIPDQHWNIGEPVYLDLSEFITDADGDDLIFRIDSALPPGVTRNGSIISGTPTTDYPTTQYTVTADDETPGEANPSPPTDLSVT